MSIDLIGRKKGMSQVFSEKGEVVPVSIIEAGPCTVLQVKTNETDSYSAIQLGYEDVKESRVTRPLLGHFKKHSLKPKKIIRESRIDQAEIDKYKIGDEITVTVFKPGDKVDVTGISKGRGFTGVIKRHGLSGAKATHGTHEHFRHQGSIGMASDPSRVFKGRRMPGHYGATRVTTQRLTVVDVIEEKNLLLVKGAVPGANNGCLIIRKSVKS